MRSASASVTARARSMYASKPSTWRSMKARSKAPRRSSSAVSAHARIRSVPGRSAMCRSACSATLVRTGSTHHQLAARAPHLVDERHQVQVRPRDVVAPGHDQPGQRHLLRPHARARRRTSPSTPRRGCPRTAASCRGATRRACGRSAGPSSRPRACRAAPRSSAGAPPAGPCAAITAVTRAWMTSSASSQEIGSEAPLALRRRRGGAASGCGRRRW